MNKFKMTSEKKAEELDVDDEQVDILDAFIILAKHKRWLFGSILFCGSIGLVISLIMTPIYTAKATILPPQQSQSTGMGALLGQLGALSGMSPVLSGLKNPNDLYVGILQSQTIADDLINQYKLKARYQVKLNDDAVKNLKASTNIASGKDGLIVIQFSDKDPKLAAIIANAYVDELKKLTENLAVTDASQRRLFFDKQLKIARQQLTDAEEQLRELQEKSGMLTLDSQVKASITGLAQLKASLASKEIELQAMKTFATQENPDYQRLSSEVLGLRAQLNQLQEKSEDGLLATQQIPKTGLEYMRRLRDQKFAETVYELMLKQDELAKVDEAKDTSIIQQLDRATAPERKSKPKRAVIVLVSLMIGGVLGILSAILRETLINGDPIARQKWAKFMIHLKSN